ncbi:MAG: response regulator [Bryobacteraceae bacterium]
MSPSALILLVDDDASLLAFAERYLRRMGYRVRACAGATLAWENFSEAPESFSVAVIDLVLGESTGQELGARMAAANPRIGLLFTSGFASDEAKLPQGLSAPVRFLQKPFTGAMLVEAVEALLRGGAGAKPATAP